MIDESEVLFLVGYYTIQMLPLCTTDSGFTLISRNCLGFLFELVFLNAIFSFIQVQ